MTVESLPLPLRAAQDASRPEGERLTAARLNQSSNTKSSARQTLFLPNLNFSVGHGGVNSRAGYTGVVFGEGGDGNRLPRHNYTK